MKPALIVRNDSGGTDQPDTGFLLFNQDLTSSELLAKGDLPVGAYDFDARGMRSGLHEIFFRAELK